ncbi:MAG: hypothetical protein HYV95_10075 [Opitutae bacterium]|nr:hypothetical protein [Opitutae bacterium]
MNSVSPLSISVTGLAAEKGYDPVFGARPLKRFLQRHLETRLARALLSGEIAECSEVEFGIESGELVIK